MPGADANSQRTADLSDLSLIARHYSLGLRVDWPAQCAAVSNPLSLNMTPYLTLTALLLARSGVVRYGCSDQEWNVSHQFKRAAKAVSEE